MMNPHIISALVSKDLSLFFRNRCIAVITVLGIVGYLGMYFAMPGSVDETLEIAFYAPVIPLVFDQMKDVIYLHPEGSSPSVPSEELPEVPGEKL